MDKFGKTKFKEDLENLGHKVEDLGEDRLAIEHRIEEGKFKDRDIKVGFAVPQDFPITPPSGPHIAPRLLPIKPDGPDHNTRAATSDQFGPDWEYLSRPIPDWPRKRNVKRYVEYVEILLNTL